VTAGETMNLTEWQQRVDGLRIIDPLMKRGAWHGFLNTDKLAGGPVHGGFALVRWNLPSVVVAHDDPTEAVRLAGVLEQALDDDLRKHKLAEAA
jgi:hypothetical protein